MRNSVNNEIAYIKSDQSRQLKFYMTLQKHATTISNDREDAYRDIVKMENDIVRVESDMDIFEAEDIVKVEEDQDDQHLSPRVWKNEFSK